MLLELLYNIKILEIKETEDCHWPGINEVLLTELDYKMDSFSVIILNCF